MSIISLTGHKLSEEVCDLYDTPWRDMFSLSLYGLERPFVTKVSTLTYDLFVDALSDKNRELFLSSEMALDFAKAETLTRVKGNHAVRHASEFTPDEVVEVCLSEKSGMRYLWRHASFGSQHLLVPNGIAGLTGNSMTVFDVAFMVSLHSYSHVPVSQSVTLGDLANVIHTESDSSQQFCNAFRDAKLVSEVGYESLGRRVTDSEFIAWAMVSAWNTHYSKVESQYDYVVALSERMSVIEAWEALSTFADDAKTLEFLTRHASADYVAGLLSRGVNSHRFIHNASLAQMDIDQAVEWHDLGMKLGLREAKQIPALRGRDVRAVDLKMYTDMGVKDLVFAADCLEHDIDPDIAASITS